MPQKPHTCPLSQPFWDALAAEQFVAPKCNACGKFFFIAEPLCIHCSSPDWEWRDSRRSGSIYSLTTVNQAISPDQPVPFHLAIVETDDGWSLLTHIVDSPATPAIGDRVRLQPTWLDDVAIPTFVLDDG